MNGRATPGDPLPARPASADTDLACQVNAAWNALTYVYDPELYLDVVSLGLVYDVREENGAVVVEMTLTTPGCPASEALPEMARIAVADALGDGAAVDLRVVWDPPWSPAMIDDIAAAPLGFRISPP